MYDLAYKVAQIYLCLGLATFIHFLWVYRWEVIKLHIEHPLLSFYADFMTMMRCVIFWPKIQYLNVFGKDEEDV